MSYVSTDLRKRTKEEIIDDGDLFYWNSSVTGVNILTPLLILYETGSKHVHYDLNFQMSRIGFVEMFESPTVSANGTVRTPLNHRRDSTKTPEMKGYYNPTVTDDGLLIYGEQIGTDGSNPTGNNGGFTKTFNNLRLKPNTKYLLRVATLVDDTRISGVANFFEEP